MALTELQVRQAKPKEKSYMIRDESGLYLEVVPAGGRYWRLRYWIQGKEKKISLGVYPLVSLKQAREARDEARRNISQGLDPQAVKKPPEVVTFQAIAQEWFRKQIEGVKSATYAREVSVRMARYLFPLLGERPINDITPPELLMTLRSIEALGLIDSAHRTKQIAGQIFRYGIATGVCERDPSADLRGALAPLSKGKHYAGLTDPKDIAGLLRAMETFRGSAVVKSALWFSAYTFLRPGEVRHLEWSEVNLETQEIRNPAEKMKMRRLHIVPLSHQVMELLRQLKPLTGYGKYVFPNIRSADGSEPMSPNTITSALRRLGFTTEEISAHGFRSMASTILHEQGWPTDAVERQLAHVEGNSVKAAYNYAEHLPERRKMMQAWADWLDSLK